jgi:hypothetical protein
VLLDGELSIDNSMAHGRRTIMPFAAHRMPRLVLGAIAVLLWTTVAFAQTATVTHNVNLRSDASSEDRVFDRSSLEAVARVLWSEGSHGNQNA